MTSDFRDCHFGGAPKQRESPQARTARVLEGERTQIDMRALRLRQGLQLRARSRNSLLGAGEGASLGAGL